MVRDKAAAQQQGRRWFAVALATALMFLSYTLLMFGFSVSDDETAFAGGLIGIGLGLVPAVFLAVSALSHHEHAIRASLLATALWVVFAIPIAIVDIPTGLVAGFGAGGVVAIPRSGHHAIAYRCAAVALCVVYTFLVQLVVPAAGIMVGSVVPLLAVVIADLVRENEQRDPEEGQVSP